MEENSLKISQKKSEGRCYTLIRIIYNAGSYSRACTVSSTFIFFFGYFGVFRISMSLHWGKYLPQPSDSSFCESRRYIESNQTLHRD